MTEQTDIRVQAKQFYDAGSYEEAGKLYHQIWDEQQDAFSGGRYAYCLRKCGHADAALTIAQQVAEKHPDDIYVRREVVWALYDAQFKLARERGDLGRMVHFGQQILDLTNEELPVRLVSFAVISAAKDKMKWDIVSAWCDRIDPQTLETEAREMGGRKVISEREQWYFAKVKSLVQLEQWDSVRELAVEAMQAFPRKRDFARWAAQALAGQGQIAEAILELEQLAQRDRPEWYLLSDLAELKFQDGQLDAAYQVACRAALAFGEDKAKVGLYVLIGNIALALQHFDVALRHAALSRLVRTREAWKIPGAVTMLENQAKQALAKTGATVPDIPDDVRGLRTMCRKDWEAVVPPELRPQPKPKRKGRRQHTPRPTGDVQTGTIKTYLTERGFGFIVPDQGGDDIFFHIKNVRDIEEPAAGMKVQYHVTETEKGLNALNVQLVNDE